MRGGGRWWCASQSINSPPALSAEGPSDFCMQTHSRSQLEPSLPRADKDSPCAALPASLIPAASPRSLAYKERVGEKKFQCTIYPTFQNTLHVSSACCDKKTELNICAFNYSLLFVECFMHRQQHKEETQAES